MQRGGHVYLLTNKANKLLYTGSTSALRKRIEEHRMKFYPESFTAKYNCSKLVYYRHYTRIEEANGEEQRIKGGSRKAKIALVNSMNPEWKDLWKEIDII